MELISSDTNVWIDFSVINKLELPFLLPYTYLMSEDAIEKELCSPGGLKENLIKLGLKKAYMTIEEFSLADIYSSQYIQLSVIDSIALAIAKQRNIRLLTGDMALRKADHNEKVEVFGTIGILDMLLKQEYITLTDFKDCISRLKELNGKEVRLPSKVLEERLKIE